MKEWLEGALASTSNHKYSPPYNVHTEQHRAWMRGYNDHTEGMIRTGSWFCVLHGETRKQCTCGENTNFVTKVPR